MRVLFTCGPANAHLYPLVPTAWGVRAAGHDVLVATSEDFCATVTAAGLPAAPVADPVDLVGWLKPPGDASYVGTPDRSSAMARSGRRFGDLAVRSLPGTRRLVEEWRPDLVVAEPLEFAGPAAASVAGVPWVRHGWGLTTPAEMPDAARDAFADAGLPPWSAPVTTLDPCPPPLQIPGTTDGSTVRYVPYNGSAVLADWQLAAPTRPRVCLTLGTILPRDHGAGALWRRILTVLTAAGVEVVLAIPDAHRETMGELPDGVRVGRFPLAETLRRCAAIVHHGGSSTTMTAMAVGLPQLIVPHFADQFGNAERIPAAGAGLQLHPATATDDDIERAVDALLHDERIAATATDLAAENASRRTAAATLAGLLQGRSTERIAMPDTSTSDAVEPLLLAVGGRPDDVTRAVDGLGAGTVADLLIAEIAARCTTTAGQPETAVQLDLTHGDERTAYLLTVTEKGLQTAARGDADAPLWISYELSDLARLLYGPARCRAGHTRRVELRLGRDVTGPPDPKAWLARMDPVSRAARAVFEAIEPTEPDLADLAVRYGTDKWGGLHWYMPHYQRYFTALRDEPVRLLEIGIGGYEQPHLGGGSLRTWRRYFRRGQIYGLDIFDKSGLDAPRLHTLRGDQNDPEFLRRLGEQYGPFDIIIDDGSHLSEHVITSLNALLPYVRSGGYYVVEDLQFSYWPGYDGNATERDSPATSVGFLKRIVDALHHEDQPERGPDEPSYFDEQVGAVHFHRGLAVLEKSTNVEGSIPPWIPRLGRPPED